MAFGCRESLQLVLFMAAATGKGQGRTPGLVTFSSTSGPPTAGQPRFYQHSSEGCSQLDPCSALTLQLFQVTALSKTMFKVNTPSLPFHSSLIPLSYSSTSKSAEIHGSRSAQWRCLGKLAITPYPSNFINHATQTPESV